MIYNFSNPNLIALAVNISRAYEIAKVGNHTVKIVANELACKQDIDLLNEFYGFKEVHNPDLVMELAYGTQDVLNCFKTNGCETLQDINKRLPGTLIEVSDTLDTPSFTLLKTAIQRLQLGVNDVVIIHKVAKTIASLAESNKIKAEHIAEAIQYRPIKDNN